MTKTIALSRNPVGRLVLLLGLPAQDAVHSIALTKALTSFMVSGSILRFVYLGLSTLFLMMWSIPSSFSAHVQNADRTK